jgi:phytoene dehydrogenase-like protein
LSRIDAIVVGAGPNGLAAAITLAQAGWSVEVREAADTIGGGSRTDALTLPGFRHDVCSAVHPTALVSPFLRALDLESEGLEWIHAPTALAHPLDDGSAAVLETSIEATAEGVGADGRAYRRAVGPFVERWQDLVEDILRPIRGPGHPLLMARFGLKAMQPAARFARATFRGEPARALFAGIAAHGIVPLEHVASAAIGVVLGVAGHAVGWPAPRGGSQAVADALAARLRRLGGEIRTGCPVTDIGELGDARSVFLDVSPRQVLDIAGARLPAGYRRSLEAFRYGPGVFKMDWALDGPVPWTAEACRRALTVHVGGRLDEIASAERDMWEGRVPEKPFVLFSQPSLFDATRAPAGKHTAWAYCHVPHASTEDMTGRIEAQIERFAPGFRDRILARSSLGPAELEARNANLVCGVITGGAQTLRQTFFRPSMRYDPYSTPAKGIYICSSSTPPGAGVHGMCGYNAALRALRSGTEAFTGTGSGAGLGLVNGPGATGTGTGNSGG